MRRALALILGLLAGAAGAAERIELAAVGVLGREGRPSCTGNLIAPDLVLTAAHCLAFLRSGDSVAGDVFFRTATVAGTAEERRGVDAMIHPFWQNGNPEGAPGLRHDLALLVLEAPITAVPPLRVGPPPEGGEAFIVASYPGAKGEIARQKRCPTVAVRGDVLMLGCRVRSGESGSAVLRKLPDGRVEISAVLAATTTGDGERFALASAAAPRLAQLLALLGRERELAAAPGSP